MGNIETSVLLNPWILMPTNQLTILCLCTPKKSHPCHPCHHAADVGSSGFSLVNSWSSISKCSRSTWNEKTDVQVFQLQRICRHLCRAFLPFQFIKQCSQLLLPRCQASNGWFLKKYSQFNVNRSRCTCIESCTYIELYHVLQSEQRLSQHFYSSRFSLLLSSAICVSSAPLIPFRDPSVPSASYPGATAQHASWNTFPLRHRSKRSLRQLGGWQKGFQLFLLLLGRQDFFLLVKRKNNKREVGLQNWSSISQRS